MASEFHALTRMLFGVHIIIYSEAGIGKTALLEMFRSENSTAYRRVNLLCGYEIEINEGVLIPYLLPSPLKIVTAFPELLIIDGFDQITTKATREKVADILREGWLKGHRLILSARRQINEKVFEQYASVFKLRGLKFV